ncbi:MAG: flavodoxin domain-containing protein, partial [Spirochaetaceae bacterium]|nr:flavodoxin domain-containing protein [Spirochaetaceae bacterium]
MKGIVIFASRNGSTRRYASWLAEETGFALEEAGKVRRLDGYDVVVLGSCIVAGKPAMANWIKKRWPELRGRKPVLFTVAGAEKADPKRQAWVRDGLGEAIASELPHVALDGKMVFADMRPFDRALMGLAIKMTAKKDPEEARAMGREFDRVKREDLALVKAALAARGAAAS